MRHLWKIANRMFIVFAGKFYGEIVFWKNPERARHFFALPAFFSVGTDAGLDSSTKLRVIVSTCCTIHVNGYPQN